MPMTSRSLSGFSGIIDFNQDGQFRIHAGSRGINEAIQIMLTKGTPESKTDWLVTTLKQTSVDYFNDSGIKSLSESFEQKLSQAFSSNNWVAVDNEAKITTFLEGTAKGRGLLRWHGEDLNLNGSSGTMFAKVSVIDANGQTKELKSKEVSYDHALAMEKGRTNQGDAWVPVSGRVAEAYVKANDVSNIPIDLKNIQIYKRPMSQETLDALVKLRKAVQRYQADKMFGDGVSAPQAEMDKIIEQAERLYGRVTPDTIVKTMLFGGAGINSSMVDVILNEHNASVFRDAAEKDGLAVQIQTDVHLSVLSRGLEGINAYSNVLLSGLDLTSDAGKAEFQKRIKDLRETLANNPRASAMIHLLRREDQAEAGLLNRAIQFVKVGPGGTGGLGSNIEDPAKFAALVLVAIYKLTEGKKDMMNKLDPAQNPAVAVINALYNSPKFDLAAVGSLFDEKLNGSDLGLTEEQKASAIKFLTDVGNSMRAEDDAETAFQFIVRNQDRQKILGSVEVLLGEKVSEELKQKIGIVTNFEGALDNGKVRRVVFGAFSDDTYKALADFGKQLRAVVNLSETFNDAGLTLSESKTLVAQVSALQEGGKAVSPADVVVQLFENSAYKNQMIKIFGALGIKDEEFLNAAVTTYHATQREAKENEFLKMANFMASAGPANIARIFADPNSATQATLKADGEGEALWIAFGKPQQSRLEVFMFALASGNTSAIGQILGEAKVSPEEITNIQIAALQFSKEAAANDFKPEIVQKAFKEKFLPSLSDKALQALTNRDTIDQIARFVNPEYDQKQLEVNFNPFLEGSVFSKGEPAGTDGITVARDDFAGVSSVLNSGAVTIKNGTFFVQEAGLKTTSPIYAPGVIGTLENVINYKEGLPVSASSINVKYSDMMTAKGTDWNVSYGLFALKAGQMEEGLYGPPVPVAATFGLEGIDKYQQDYLFVPQDFSIAEGVAVKLAKESGWSQTRFADGKTLNGQFTKVVLKDGFLSSAALYGEGSFWERVKKEKAGYSPRQATDMDFATFAMVEGETVKNDQGVEEKYTRYATPANVDKTLG
ncbi:MAG TPA: hypothetical protein P5246_04000, partial [Candidatus Omnitrophota bacterium]|nr:hypothetical protein [Candidatus Omnitrophota bacterium]